MLAVPTTTKALTARVAAPRAERIALVAAQYDRSSNWVLNQALELYLRLEEDRHAHTLKALADVAAKRTVDHASVKQWAEDLNKGNLLAAKIRKPRKSR